MKKFIFLLTLIFTLSFNSCVVDDDYYTPCYESLNYNYYNINKFNSPAIVRVYFTNFCPQNNGYYLLIADPIYGTKYINGRWWSIVTPMYFNSPIITYVDYNYLLPYRNYKCIILSTSGVYSQEFYISTY